MRGNGHDAQPAPAGLFPFPDRRGSLKTIHLRHLDVHQNDIQGFPFRNFEGLAPVVGDQDRVTVPLKQMDGHLLVHRIVLGEQDTQVARCDSHGVVLLLNRSLPKRQRHGEMESAALRALAAFPGCPGAFHPNPAVHQAGKFRADRQPEACAAVLASGGPIGLFECRENGLLFFRGNADAVIGHHEFQVRLLPGWRGQANLHPNLAGGCEFNRIADEVQEHLSQPAVVAR